MNTGIIAIIGGIGSGKSVVSRILRCMGYKVYDCDSRAKALMDESAEIKAGLRNLIHPGSVDADGRIDRRLLSEVVFADPEKLAVLNAMVHSAVKADILSAARREKLLFVESAILYTSGLDAIADSVWEVTAPEELRIERVMRRSALTYNQIKARIESQADEVSKPSHKLVINDGIEAVLPRIEQLLSTSD